MARIALGILLLAATTGFAATDHELMERGLRKYGVPSSAQPSKTTCVCQDGGSRHGRVGWLHYDGTTTAFTANCGVASFNASTGAVSLVTACYTYEIIGK